MNFFKKLLRYLILSKRYTKSKIYYGASIDNSSSVGINTVLFSNVILQNTQVSDNTYIQAASMIINTKIAKFCSIAGDVKIGLPDHPTHMVSTSPIFYDNTQPLPFFFVENMTFTATKKTTIINCDVWIGQNSIIKAGITVGVGAVIGAGSVVTKDVEPYSIVGGVPARHIKYRFEKEIREKLLTSKWWDFDEDKLKILARYFESPKSFLEKIEESNVDWS